jgi:hypothetical protein
MLTRTWRASVVVCTVVALGGACGSQGTQSASAAIPECDDYAAAVAACVGVGRVGDARGLQRANAVRASLDAARTGDPSERQYRASMCEQGAKRLRAMCATAN